MRVTILTVAGHGHVNPLLPLAEALVAGGDAVEFATTSEFDGAVRATGAVPLVLDGSFQPPAAMFQAPTAGLPLNPGVASTFFAAMRAALPALMARVAAGRPDVVVTNFMFSLLAPAAREIAAPHVQFFPTYAVPDGQVPFAELADREGQSVLASLFADVARPFRAAGLNIVALPRVFQPDADAFDDRFRFVGPMVRTREPEDSALHHEIDQRANATNRPVLFLSLGSAVSDQPDFYCSCFAAFAASNWLVVAATGWADPVAIGPLPDNVIVRRSVPQLAVLKRADLFVTHGGMNSTMEGLWHGVPLVVTPHQEEQALTGQRVQELGLGLALGPDAASGVAVRAAVERVHCDPTIRDNLARMRAELHAAGGPTRAATDIRRFVSAGGGNRRVGR